MDEQEGLTITEVASELKANERTVRRWIKSGELAASKDIFGRYRITRNAINDFIKRRREKYNEGNNE